MIHMIHRTVSLFDDFSRNYYKETCLHAKKAGLQLFNDMKMGNKRRMKNTSAKKHKPARSFLTTAQQRDAAMKEFDAIQCASGLQTMSSDAKPLLKWANTDDLEEYDFVEQSEASETEQELGAGGEKKEKKSKSGGMSKFWNYVRWGGGKD